MTDKNNQLLLDIIGQRQLSHCPPHFNHIIFNLSTTEKNITNWIWENLTGRFFFGDYYYSEYQKVNKSLCKIAAFEIHSEATYFAMFLPELNKFS